MAKGTKKVKFKEFQRKHSDGFVETTTAAYIDITPEMKDMWGNVIKNAIVVLGEYYGGDMEKWKQSYREDKYNIDKGHISVDGTTVYVTLTNGNVIEFYTSEWGNINKLKHTPDILA